MARNNNGSGSRRFWNLLTSHAAFYAFAAAAITLFGVVLAFMVGFAPFVSLGICIVVFAVVSGVHYLWFKQGLREAAHWFAHETRDGLHRNRRMIIIVSLIVWGIFVAVLTIASDSINWITALIIGLGLPVVVTLTWAISHQKALPPSTVATPPQEQKIRPGDVTLPIAEPNETPTQELAPVTPPQPNGTEDLSTGEQSALETLKILAEVLEKRDQQLATTVQALISKELSSKRREYDLSLAPKLEEVPKWIRDKLGRNEELHGVIRKAWPHAIPSVTSLVVLIALCVIALPQLQGAALIAGIIAWCIATAASVVWFMKHVRWALVLTEKRFFKLTGVIQLQSANIDRAKITDFTTRRNLRGRIFGFWSCKVETAGQVQAFDREYMLAGRGALCTYYEQHLGSEK